MHGLYLPRTRRKKRGLLLPISSALAAEISRRSCSLPNAVNSPVRPLGLSSVLRVVP